MRYCGVVCLPLIEQFFEYVCVVPCIAVTKGMGVGERKGILHLELHLGKSKTALFCLNWPSVLSDLCTSHPQRRFGGCCMLVRIYKKRNLNKDKRSCNGHSTEIMCIAVMLKKSLKLL